MIVHLIKMLYTVKFVIKLINALYVINKKCYIIVNLLIHVQIIKVKYVKIVCQIIFIIYKFANKKIFANYVMIINF